MKGKKIFFVSPSFRTNGEQTQLGYRLYVGREKGEKIDVGFFPIRFVTPTDDGTGDVTVTMEQKHLESLLNFAMFCNDKGYRYKGFHLLLPNGNNTEGEDAKSDH